MIGAVDIGGTKIAVGMVSDTGQVLARTEGPTASESGPTDGLARIIAMLRETAARSGNALRGIGIGCTGRVNPLSGVLGPNEFLPGWEGMNLPAEVSRALGVPAVIENDADAAALGEAAWGAGRGARCFVYVTVSTGIGGGVTIDGRLYRGVEGAHPEIGHHVIDSSGPACFCGAHGCWESLASGRALASWVKTNYPAQAYLLTAKQICEAAERGDAAAVEAVTRTGRYLGLGLANLVTLFTPDVIALGGGLMQSRHLFWKQIHAVIEANCGLVPSNYVRLVPARLGPDAGLVGAARAWLHRFA